MDELAQLLSYKLKFVSSFPQPNVTEQQQIQILLKEKKKESLERIYEERLIQNILIKRIQAPYRIEQFFEKSKQLMQLSDKNFQPSKYTGENYQNIVKMYVEFFKKQNALLRSEQIMHIYHKKLCERNMLLPTLFNWFAQWTRKKFIGFIKYHLTNLSNIKQIQLRNSPVKRSREKIKNYDSLKVGGEQPDKVSGQQTQKQNNNKSTLLQPYYSIAISKKIHQMKSLKLIQNKSQQQPSEIRPKEKKQKKQKPKKQQQPKNEIIINKQLFLGAFAEQLYRYYKLMNGTISQLDMYYLKGVKKNDKKQEYKKNISYISNALCKYQNNDVRTSIDQYYKDYHQKFPTKRKLKLQKKKSQTKFIEPRKKQTFERLHETLQVKRHSINDIQLENPIQNKRQEIFTKRQPKVKKQLKKSIQRLGTQAHYSLNQASIMYQQKTLQLKLPDLSKNQSVKKIIMGNPGRYSKIDSNFRHPISQRRSYDLSQQKIVQQIQKEVRNMNQLFQQSRKLKKSRRQINISQLRNSMILNNQETIAYQQASLQNEISMKKNLKQASALNRLHSRNYLRQSISKHSKRNQSHQLHQSNVYSPGKFFFPKIKQ